MLALSGVVELLAFSWRWPDAVEEFERGWEAQAEIAGRTVRVRHGVGRRLCFGRVRVHTVTWLGGEPMVEGAEAEDYASTQGVVSVIKAGGRDVRWGGELPPGYTAFEVVRHRDEVVGPYARDSLAVKIREDDLAAWALHALLRRAAKPVRANGLAAVGKTSSLRPQTSVAALPPHRDRQRVAQALLAYGAATARRDETMSPTLTPDPEANALVCSDPFAFLLAVVCDQGIVAEKAWAIPFVLKQRLDGLTPQRLAADPASVAAAVKGPPALHRYVEIIPRWLVAAADRVLQDYGGDASAVWADKPTARQLRARLERFTGIGQKKAAMAVEILSRDLGVEITSLDGSDVAYDVHVRRVFLRAGLADRDAIASIVAAGRTLNPVQPGALDLPAWLVGRQWCHPTGPDCADCAIADVCPQLTDRAASVTGG